jgi:predicted house-cleaning noncanonical NTP pyrophosphatase (MazG superfamily)
MSEASVKDEIKEYIMDMNLGKLIIYEVIERIIESKTIEKYFKEKGSEINNG